MASEIFTFGRVEGSELYSIAGLSADRHGNVFVSDVLQYAVKKFSARGLIAARTGGRGKGPGQFHSPGILLAWDDTLAVMQPDDPHIQLFNSDLRFMGEFCLEGCLPMDMARGRRGGLYVATLGDADRQVLVFYPGGPGSRPRRIPLAPTGKRHPFYTGCRIAISPRGTIIVAYLFLNRVELYGSDGRLQKRFGVASMGSEINDPAGSEMPEKTYFRGVAADRKGTIVLLSGSQARCGGREIFLFTSTGYPLGSCALPEKSRMITLDDLGNLYGTNRDGTEVRKYRFR